MLDNHSGEDFLFMHHLMISEVNTLLEQLGEKALDRWSAIPAPGSSEFPVPPAWEYKDPSATAKEQEQMTRRLLTVKSDEYYYSTMAVWESFYTNPSNLRRLTLGALGNLVEMTIHNNLHMRWASEPVGYMPSPNFENTKDIDPTWDDKANDYLGDTYSSHVNNVFWYLHGWVDDCIERWREANGLDTIQWVGTWAGKLEQGWHPGDPVALTLRVRANALAGSGMEHLMPDHGHHGSNDDIAEMEEIVRALGSCRVIRNFYDVLVRGL